MYKKSSKYSPDSPLLESCDNAAPQASTVQDVQPCGLAAFSPLSLYSMRPRNEPIKTLIQQFENKKSGKVAIAGRKIKPRFEGQDWEVQKRILKLFLQSCKTDRDWAYSKVYKHWDESFYNDIKALWEERHESKCSWSVIRFFPKDYVFSQKEYLNHDGNYYHICLRFCTDPDFVIDWSRLTGSEYLEMKAYLRLHVGEEEVKRIFFGALHDICNKHSFKGSEAEEICRAREKEEPLSIKDFRSLRLIHTGIFNLNLWDLLKSIDAWNDHVISLIRDSPEFAELISSNSNYTEKTYNSMKIYICLKYFYQEMDDTYKMPSDYQFVSNLKEVPAVIEDYRAYPEIDYYSLFKQNPSGAR